MTLSPMDDFPIHQVAEPIRRVATSDRNFYDRYYFNAHPIGEDLFLIAGLGVYPNLGTTDAFACVVHKGHHHVVRASRELGEDRMDTQVGPFRVEVLEGLKRLRIVLEPNEWGLSFDLTWEGSVPAHEEPRHFVRTNERVTIDTCRLAQTGRWSGHLDIDGTHFDATPDIWWGARDRSWGVRPIGEPEPPGIGIARMPGGFFWNYAPLQFEDFSIFYMCQERADGSRELEEAVRVWPEHTGRPVESLGHPVHELEFAAGTRRVVRATLHLTEPDGTPMSVVITPIVPVYLGVGTGYGSDIDWRHGMYQGPLKVEGFTITTAEAAERAGMMNLVDAAALCELNGPDGPVGYGLWEYIVIGANEQYGFKGWDD